MKDLMVSPYFVPSMQTVMEVLDGFRQSGRHFAIVADEFGTTVGVVTLVDVLEAIVGEVPSAEERSRPLIRLRDPGSWLIDGTAPIGDIERSVAGLTFPPVEDRNYQTLAGFMIQELGSIPREGEGFSALGFKFDVIDMDRQRIDKVMVQKIEEPESAAA